jgi:SAM-dependent methyltransferase
MKTANDYSKMQKAQYSDPNASGEAIVGNYEWHEEFPYETNLLYRYADVRLPVFPTTKPERALDIGCGPGRMIRRMKPYFNEVDGADISAPMLEQARLRNPTGAFFETTGANLGAAPSNAYDFAYSTIALQHISVHSIRINILKEMLRVLKPGGKFTVQFAYLDTLPYVIRRDDPLLKAMRIARARRVTAHADWLEDRVDAAASNGLCDGAIGPQSLSYALRDFENIFARVEHWFYDIRICLKNLRGSAHSDYWASHWIFFHGEKPL